MSVFENQDYVDFQIKYGGFRQISSDDDFLLYHVKQELSLHNYNQLELMLTDIRTLAASAEGGSSFILK